MAGGPAGPAAATAWSAVPMPGTVLAVKAAKGERMRAGQPLLIVEAMKMEHTVSAPVDGVIAKLTAVAGQQVGLDEALAVISPAEQPG